MKSRVVHWMKVLLGLALGPLLFVLFWTAKWNSSVPELRTLGLVFEPSTFNFGYALQGETLQHEFTLKNISRFDAKILELSASCTCTIARGDFIGKVVKPNEKIAIPISFKTRDAEGPIAS